MTDMDLEDLIVKELKKQNLTPEEAKKVLQNLKGINPGKYKPAKLPISDSHVKFGFFTDAHIGHQAYRPDIMEHMGKRFKQDHVDFAINAGDTIEGMSGRDGHIYELTHLGATEQLNYAIQEFKKIEGIPIYSIEADSSHGGWFKSKGNMGLDIGKELEEKIKDYNFIGYDEQDVVLDNKLIIRLRHPGGGTAYAISYKMQKYIESIGGGNKPGIVGQGHFHKANYLFYRNIHAFDGGTLANQTPFMKKIGTPAHVGYWILDAFVNKKGQLNRVKQEFVPFYD